MVIIQWFGVSGLNQCGVLCGALKNRVVLLKSNSLYTKIPTVTAAVQVCSILHNRLLEYDNMIDFDCENIDPNTPDDELYERYVNRTVPVPVPVPEPTTLVYDPLLLPVPSQTIPDGRWGGTTTLH